MTKYASNSLVTKCRHQGEHIVDFIERTERTHIVAILDLGATTAAIASHIWCDHVIACLRKRLHDFTPTISKLWKSVQQQHQRTPGRLKAGFKHMKRDAIDVRYKARPHARGKNRSA